MDENDGGGGQAALGPAPCKSLNVFDQAAHMGRTDAHVNLTPGPCWAVCIRGPE
jgi:hypothetical protein